MKPLDLRKIAVAIILFAVVPVNIASAQKPAPPSPSTNSVTLPSADTLSVPEAVKSVVALRQTLTQPQLKAIQSIVNRYMSQLTAIAQKLPTPNTASATKPATATPQLLNARPSLDVAATKTASDIKMTQQLREAIAAAQAVQSKVDLEIMAILTPEQQKSYQASISPAQKHLAAAAALAGGASPSAATAPKSTAKPQLYATYCYYGGQYASMAEYFAYWAYAYGYYNYYYYGTSYGYYAYAYLYDGEGYGWTGLRNIGGGFFDIYSLGSDFNGFVYNGIDSEAYAYYDTYYGYNYAYLDYYNTGHTYAYYAWQYGYSANYYSNYAYIYAYYCYYSS